MVLNAYFVLISTLQVLQVYKLGLVILLLSVPQIEPRIKFKTIEPRRKIKTSKRQLLNPQYHPKMQFMSNPNQQPIYIQRVIAAPRAYYQNPYYPMFPVPVPIQIPQVPVRMPDGKLRYVVNPFFENNLPLQMVQAIKPGMSLYKTSYENKEKFRNIQKNNVEATKNKLCHQFLEEVTVNNSMNPSSMAKGGNSSTISINSNNTSSINLSDVNQNSTIGQLERNSTNLGGNVTISKTSGSPLEHQSNGTVGSASVNLTTGLASGNTTTGTPPRNSTGEQHGNISTTGNTTKIPEKPTNLPTTYIPPVRLEYVENYDQFEPDINSALIKSTTTTKSIEVKVVLEQSKNDTNCTNTKRKSAESFENPYLVYRKLGLLLDNIPSSMMEVNRNNILPAELPPMVVKRKRHQFT